MEEIRLITHERIDRINNSLGETNHEYIGEGCYKFYSGKVYGIVCEYGEGGEFISSILSKNLSSQAKIDAKVFVNWK